jgi:cytoskeleton protein RodZ
MTSNPPSKDNTSTILRDTRQQKGISLEMVHEATKIPLDALKAIEQGYAVHRLPPFYQRGFIRIYAKYLDLDEKTVLRAYGIQDTAAPKQPQPVAPVVPKEPRPKAKHPPQPIIEPQNHFVKDTLKPLLKRNLSGARLTQFIKVIALLIGLFFAFKMVGCVIKKAKEPKPSKTVKVEKKAPAAVAAPTPSKTPAKDKPKVKKEESKPVEKLAVDVTAAQETVSKAVETKPVKSEPKQEAKSDKKSKRIELTVRATKSGWLQVKADGQIVFQSTLKKGAAESWSATQEIELSGKNINLLEFELNGKMLGALGPSDRGAKRVVFTKDGLSVKK